MTIAGSGTAGFSGDNGPATNARLNEPYGIAVDSTGSIYFADQGNTRIRKISASGIITTVAGNGTQGFSGDNGPATNAQLSGPYWVAVDAFGNFFIADRNNNRIRKVSNGTITTVAGSGPAGFLYGGSNPSSGSFGGDGGPATSAELNEPMAVAVDSGGNLYIADYQNRRIRKVSANGIITTIAGNGLPGPTGDGGPATSAQLSAPCGIAVDSTGSVYFADMYTNTVRKIANGVITTVAGGGTSVGSDPATMVQLKYPCGIGV
ncbi:MAG: hypothetical protein ABSG41_26120, partial [Bryobacteraceae bacterium]